MSDEPEIFPVAGDLRLLSDGRPSGDGPAWIESGLHARYLKRLRIAAAFALAMVLVWAAGFWFLTRPFHEDWPRTQATVVRTHEFYAKGKHCEVYLGFAAGGQPRTVMFSGFAPCSMLPSTGDTVTVAVDPTDATSVRIIGYDGPLWADIGFAAALLAVPAPMTWLFLLAAVVRFRRARKAGGDRPWRAVTVRFISRTLYRGTVTARLSVLDADGNERTFHLSGPSPDLSGFPNTRRGSMVTIWLAGDGGGNVLINQPGSGRATAGRIYVPNAFELKTMSV